MIAWDEFWYRFIDETLFDLEDRPKTFGGLKLLAERLPANISFPVTVTVFAPGAWRYGMVLKTVAEAIVYLPAALEEDVDFTVAHEFAHIVLGDFGAVESEAAAPYFEQPTEHAADDLVRKWGYSVPAYRQPRKS
jgi:hypothetical protein